MSVAISETSSHHKIEFDPLTHEIFWMIPSTLKNYEKSTEEEKGRFVAVPFPGTKTTVDQMKESMAELKEDIRYLKKKDQEKTDTIEYLKRKDQENTEAINMWRRERCLLIAGEIISRNLENPEVQDFLERNRGLQIRISKKRNFLAHPSWDKISKYDWEMGKRTHVIERYIVDFVEHLDPNLPRPKPRSRSRSRPRPRSRSRSRPRSRRRYRSEASYFRH